MPHHYIVLASFSDPRLTKVTWCYCVWSIRPAFGFCHSDMVASVLWIHLWDNNTRSTATDHTCSASSINTHIAPKIAWAPILLLRGGRAWSILSKALTAKETATQFYISPVALCTSSCKLTCHIAARTCPRTAKSKLVTLWLEQWWIGWQFQSVYVSHIFHNVTVSKPLSWFLSASPSDIYQF